MGNEPINHVIARVILISINLFWSENSKTTEPPHSESARIFERIFLTYSMVPLFGGDEMLKFGEKENGENFVILCDAKYGSMFCK